jgi:Holliday junction resolvasome RuvABC endonuclease subunit
MQPIKVVGFDPSLRNWGLAVGTYHPDDKRLTIEHVDVICPTLPTKKSVRQNSLDLSSSHQHSLQVLATVKGSSAIFAEVPVGSQSARAMASYGICVGVLGFLRASGYPFFEVTPEDVKIAGFGNKTSTKAQMIQWATTAHPEAPWPTRKEHGQVLVNAGKAEHMADAVACIHAGIASSPFQQLLALATHNTLDPRKEINNARFSQAN